MNRGGLLGSRHGKRTNIKCRVARPEGDGIMRPLGSHGCVAVTLLIVFMSGCASQSVVETYTYNGPPNTKLPADSVAYYLPKQLIAIDIERAKEAVSEQKPKEEPPKKAATSSSTVGKNNRVVSATGSA